MFFGRGVEIAAEHNKKFKFVLGLVKSYIMTILRKYNIILVNNNMFPV